MKIKLYRENPKYLVMILMAIFFMTTSSRIMAQGLIDDLTVISEEPVLINSDVTRVQLDDQTVAINYVHRNDRDITPYTVSYDYVQVNTPEQVVLPAKSFLSDLDMYFGENVNILTLNDDNVVFANVLAEGQKLAPTSARYSVTLDDTHLIEYKVNIANRHVVRSEMIELNNENTKAYIVESTLQLTKLTKAGEAFLSSNEYLHDWFIPGFGIIKRQRILKSGKNISILSEAELN